MRRVKFADGICALAEPCDGTARAGIDHLPDEPMVATLSQLFSWSHFVALIKIDGVFDAAVIRKPDQPTFVLPGTSTPTLVRVRCVRQAPARGQVKFLSMANKLA